MKPTEWLHHPSPSSSVPSSGLCGGSGPLALPPMGWWQLDPTNCVANATIRHAVFSKVRIHFRVASGALRITANPEESSVHATLDATTANSGDATRDSRIRDADFLCIDRYPTMTFQSTAVTKRSGNKWDLDGDLTIRDRTRPVTLATLYHGTSGHPDGDQRSRFTARTTINRETYGLTWNQALDTGGVVLGQAVAIELIIEAVRRHDNSLAGLCLDAVPAIAQDSAFT